MRSFILCLISFLVMGSSFAITPERVEELNAEGQRLLQAKQVRVKEINQIDTRMVEIQGILKEHQLEEKKNDTERDE